MQKAEEQNQTVLSLAKQSAMTALLGLGRSWGLVVGGIAAAELLEEVDEAVEELEELTKWAVSVDWGLSIKLPLPLAAPFTGELPDVKPSSAELEWRPLLYSWM